jgi:CheY-like chemotaxis protein
MLILNADDDVLMRELLAQFLRVDTSSDLVQAMDGTDAWNRLQKGLNPDLCLFDVNMPGIDGIELVRAMRASSQYTHIRVALITGSGVTMDDPILEGLNLVAVLPKPFPRRMLNDILEQASEGLPKPFAQTWIKEPRNILRLRGLSLEQYRDRFNEMVEYLKMATANFDEEPTAEQLRSLRDISDELLRRCAPLGVRTMTGFIYNLQSDESEGSSTLMMLCRQMRSIPRYAPELLDYLNYLAETDPIYRTSLPASS